jgi:enoyl-[acyl-carrier protein] reductase / trans-2-enoyl-CoA reductase (NAD+)
VQDARKAIRPAVTTDNLLEITDYAGYKYEYLQLFGFDREMDYEAEVEADRRFDCLKG